LIPFSKSKKDYLHGKTPDLTDEQLMSHALIAYQVREEAGIWGNLSHEQELIVAMQAQLSGIKDKRLKLDTKSSKTKGKGKKKQGNKTLTEYQQLNPWKYKNTNHATTKVYNSKTYYWCKYHNNGNGMWVEHQLHECRNRERDESGATPPTPSANNTASAETQAHAAIAEIQDDSENEEDSDSE
jgi:hypothetical protein